MILNIVKIYSIKDALFSFHLKYADLFSMIFIIEGKIFILNKSTVQVGAILRVEKQDR